MLNEGYGQQARVDGVRVDQPTHLTDVVITLLTTALTIILTTGLITPVTTVIGAVASPRMGQTILVLALKLVVATYGGSACRRGE